MLEAGDHVGLEVIPPEAELLLVIHFRLVLAKLFTMKTRGITALVMTTEFPNFTKKRANTAYTAFQYYEISVPVVCLWNVWDPTEFRA